MAHLAWGFIANFRKENVTNGWELICLLLGFDYVIKQCRSDFARRF